MNNPLAFPQPVPLNSFGESLTPAMIKKGTEGMTLRDYVAVHQLQGASANPGYCGFVTAEMVRAAFEFADIFLTEREKLP